jgi:small subunit ribosomal protein S1
MVFHHMSSPNTPDMSALGETAAQDATSFADILSEYERSHHADAAVPAQALQGTIVAVSDDAVVVDVGRKMEGVLSPDGLKDPNGEWTVKPGDTVLVSVTGRGPEGYYQLSTITVKRPKDWNSLEKASKEGLVIAGVVSEVVKGGLRVDVGVPAFMPASRSGAKDAAEMEKLIGQDIRCKIIKLDIEDEDVVVDRRAVLEAEEALVRQQAFDQLQEGAVVRGTVRSLTDFGAFVDIGGVDGLLHVADMAWARVSKPSDLLSTGAEVEVKILKINRENRRVSLGMKQLMPDPWTLASEKYKVGDRVRGKVTRATDFGAFVELESGVEGLIHLSEMSWSKKQRKPSEIVKRNEMVEVVVLSVNFADHRIGLGLKQALGDPWDEAVKKYTPGTIVDGPVASLTKFGAFVELEDGVEGMIHIADITHEKRLEHPKDALKEKQQVRAVVLEVDRERRRIRLGMKQLEPTTVDEYIGEHKIGEVVTGRLVDVSRDIAKVELGDGVFGVCRLPKPAKAKAEAEQGSPSADISSLTAMLSAKWKQGKSQSSGSDEAAHVGQIRSLRIVAMETGQKKIELELVG